MILSVHQPQYLPWLGYFDKIDKSDGFVFLDNVQYKHREFQNRNKIRVNLQTPGGCLKGEGIWLSVPVVYKGHSRARIGQVLIDNGSDWQRKHWGSLKSAYSAAPFFKEHSAFFEEVYSRRWERLADLNIHIIKYILEYLKIDTPLYYESRIGTTQEATERIIELCKKLNADTYLSGSGAKVYLEEERFAQSGIKLEYQHFVHPQYRQQFVKQEGDFLPYMSIVDLLFNEGPESINILRGKTENV